MRSFYWGSSGGLSIPPLPGAQHTGLTGGSISSSYNGGQAADTPPVWHGERPSGRCRRILPTAAVTTVDASWGIGQRHAIAAPGSRRSSSSRSGQAAAVIRDRSSGSQLGQNKQQTFGGTKSRATNSISPRRSTFGSRYSFSSPTAFANGARRREGLRQR